MEEVNFQVFPVHVEVVLWFIAAGVVALVAFNGKIGGHLLPPTFEGSEEA